jgi:Helix-turn-helix domain
VTQPDHSTISKAVFTSAWIDFCRISEGRFEYWRRFGDYLFQSPPREIPRALLSLPPTFRPRGRRPASRKPRPPMPGAERIPIEKAAAILGPPVRTMQALAARGEIPGAAKIGGRWTFDIEKLRRLVRHRERETWQSGKPLPDATGAAVPSGVALRYAGDSSAGRLKQLIQRSRKRVGKLAKSGR